MIEANKINETHVILKCDRGIAQELSEYFSFLVPGHKFMMAFKNKIWDGFLRLAKIRPNGDVEFYVGLMKQLEVFCADRDYKLNKNYDENLNTISKEELSEFIDKLDIHAGGKKIEVRDYQFNGVLNFINNKRLVLLSPTSCLDPNTIIEVELDGKLESMTLNELRLYVEDGADIKIGTPSGYEKITDVYRKNGPGIEIKFENDEIPLIAADNHLVWFNNTWTDVINLNVGDIINGKQISKITPTEIKDWIDFTIDAEHESYFHNGILHHNSGKSLILYIITRYLIENECDKGLLIVPNTSLINQLFSDFNDYASNVDWNAEDDIHLIFAGQEKVSDKKVYFSTYQSIMENNMKNTAKIAGMTQSEYFSKFDFVIADEAHLFSSKETTSILEKCVNAEYRIGVTGTLNGQKIHSLQLESLFGPVKKVITTKQLMDNNQVANLEIKCLVLKYPEEIAKLTQKLKYQEEIAYLILNKERNRFIKNLTLSLKGNTLLLFQFVEKHGDVLYEMISNSKHAKDKVVYYINGSIKAEEREIIRKAMETQDNVILIGSVGTVATGTNIKNLHNIIFTSPSKSRVRNLQAIGRILRLNDNKDKAILYDIADDLRYKKHQNYTILHFKERIKIYNEEKFEYKLINVDLDVTL